MSNRPTRFYSALSVGWSSSAGPALSDTNRQPGDPSGWTQAYVLGVHSGTHPAGYDIGAGGALTGDSQALRVRAENRVDTMTGQLRALQVQARNFNTSAGGSMQAATLESIAGGFSLGTLRGVEIISDNTTGTGTITTMVGARIRVIGAGTITNGPWALQIVNDAATALAAPKQLQAFIKCENSSGTAANECFADLASTRINRTTGLYSISLTADDNVLFYYRDKDGSAHAVVATDGDALAVRS